VILIDDTHKGRHYVSLAFKVMQRFLMAGFVPVSLLLYLRKAKRRDSSQLILLVNNRMVFCLVLCGIGFAFCGSQILNDY